MPTFHHEVDGIAASPSPLSQVVEAGDLVYLSGQVPVDADGALVADDIDSQARQALQNLRTCLRAVGLDTADVVKVNAFLADLADAPGWNAAYHAVFTPPYPVRTTVGVNLPGFRIEIEAVACRR
jgi:2-iminobutanoate/2-iminopropanoate deaminase